MKRIYLLKRLEFRNGQHLLPHVPLQATFDQDRQLWFVNGLAVQQKYIEKMVDAE